ncbi:TIGR03564 family F420-dependent LLM class oxidoreductase [uncultured Microbacterium sp.]|uniref:TIGR03564 family F420-dependent LLM class oxidoreductase n=1 Tax=uncultured Microbacterium sp. TaxID=191216 RepID=UPI0035CC3A71
MTGFGVGIAARGQGNHVDDVIAQALESRAAGVGSAWFGQRWDYDAVTLAALVGRAVPDVMVGTAAIPIFGRHPLHVAMSTQTAQAATGGRFQLGLALGAPSLIAQGLGVAHDRPIGLLREFLTVIRDVQLTGTADFHGGRITAAPPWPMALPGATAAPVYVAAMGPQAVRVSGELADGILPFLAGPRTLGEEIVPVLSAAAQAAGRPAPRVFAFMAGVVTSDVDRARAAATAALEHYESIPSYRRVLDLEGVRKAGDLAVIGDEEAVAARVRSHLDAGATDIVFTQTHLFSDEDRLRTYRLLGDLGRAA